MYAIHLVRNTYEINKHKIRKLLDIAIAKHMRHSQNLHTLKICTYTVNTTVQYNKCIANYLIIIL